MSMEQNENREVLEQPEVEYPRDPHELTEEEKQEILSVFSETNENKRQRSSFKLTIKNQIILVGAVLVVAALLLGSYFLFLKEEAPLPSFYVLDGQTVTVLDGLDTDVEITFCNRVEGELTEQSDPDVFRIYTYATLYAAQTGDVEISFNTGDTFNGVKVTAGGKTLEYAYSSFYKTRPIDNAVYGFDGEAMLTNAILELTGKEKLKLAVRPLDGFDKDGNTVLASGGVVMFPMVNRSDISYLEVENPTGEFLIYQNEKGIFYFDGCEYLTYNAETFASLLVDCRYVVTAGKLEDRLDYAVYGFGKDEELTCRYTLMTVPASDGSFYVHQVQIGKKAASGAYYYAMYFGLKMKGDEVIEQFPSDKVFLLPYSNVESNLTKPVENFFEAQIVNGIQDVNDIYEIGKVEMDFYHGDPEKDLHAVVLNLPVLDFSDNASSNNSSIGELLKDKKTYGKSGLSYSDWTGETDGAYLAGLASSDGESFTVRAAVTNIASDGVYECTFGLLLDSDNKKYAAILPDEVSIRYSYDGENFNKLTDHGLDFSDHKEDTVKEYTFRIESDGPVVMVELTFEMPQKIGYLVMDELRVMADGIDAVPNDALTGLWRLMAPSSLIPEGKNYAYMDSTNFADFINGLATLKGDSVAKVGISEHHENEDDTINMEMLKEFGLDTPAMHFSYTFEGFVTDLYVSAYDEENKCYYVYSTITGDLYEDGRELTFCTGLVARVTKETAPWLEWELLEYVDHSMVGMYVYEIEEMSITYGGKEYVFNVTAKDKELTSVLWGDTEMDEESFRYLYLSVVQLYMRDVYEPAEGDTAEEYMRIKIKTTTDSKEFVFYRVSSSRAYYTVNGAGSYYCRVSSLRNIVDKLELFIAGEKVGR
ncbi:MAG: hypothetical protein E7651_01420 [Ruminococcaceae bacterium]|nr:hypothetical protein [Oscillospiraceae bacterium]